MEHGRKIKVCDLDTLDLIEEEVYPLALQADEKIRQLLSFTCAEKEYLLCLTDKAFHRFTKREDEDPSLTTVPNVDGRFVKMAWVSAVKKILVITRVHREGNLKGEGEHGRARNGKQERKSGILFMDPARFKVDDNHSDYKFLYPKGNTLFERKGVSNHFAESPHSDEITALAVSKPIYLDKW